MPELIKPGFSLALALFLVTGAGSSQCREVAKARPVKPAGKAEVRPAKCDEKAVEKNTGSDTAGGEANQQLLKMAFVKASCWGCHPHGENSLNGDHPLKGPGFLKAYPDDKSLAEFIRRGNQEKGMPAFPPERLSDKDLKLVIGFIRSLSSTSH